MHRLSITGLAALVRAAAAAAATLAATSAAQAQVSYTYKSPALDNTSFAMTFTVDAALADGTYGWGYSSSSPTPPFAPGFSYSVSDGYATVTKPSGLVYFDLGVSGGAITAYEVVVEDHDSVDDPYYGYTYFEMNFNGVGGSELQDAANPGIVGLDYDGHHIPVASGGPGTWSVSVTAVPEPATGALLVAGLASIAVGARCRTGR